LLPSAADTVAVRDPTETVYVASPAPSAGFATARSTDPEARAPKLQVVREVVTCGASATGGAVVAEEVGAEELVGAVDVGAVDVAAVDVGAVVGAEEVGAVVGTAPGSTANDHAMSALFPWVSRTAYVPATKRVRGTTSTAWSLVRICRPVDPYTLSLLT
jgi:hypothetical protein